MASDIALKPAIAAVFGPEALQASEAIKAVFDSPTFTDIGSSSVVADSTFKLAPSFRNLTDDYTATMDEVLVTALAATIKELKNADEEAQAKGQNMSWEDIIRILDQSVVLQPSPEQPVALQDTYTCYPHDPPTMEIDGSAYPETVKDIMAFYHNTINDDDVIQANSITIGMFKWLANLVASTPQYVDYRGTFFGRKYTGDNVQRTMLDIGVILFPDAAHPYVKVYRLQLHAWCRCRRVLMLESNISGLHIEFNSKTYVPRQAVLALVMPEVHEGAMKELKALFG